MSLKKEIIAAVAAEEGVVKINNVARLDRYTVTVIGDPVDKLVIDFKYVVGIPGGWRKEITARDYDGIIAEIQTATEEYFQMVAKAANKHLVNGYR